MEKETTGKNIIICFDGTCNHPSDAKQERSWFGSGEIEDNGITNILKLHLLFGGDLNNQARTANQHSFYYSGVGTYGNWLQRVFNAAFSPKNLDVRNIIKDAKKDLLKNYEKNDRIFIFGFSRGAAIARRFSAIIDDFLPDTAHPVRFLGVFDTVASIGAPNLDKEDKPMSDVIFQNGTVSTNVKEALHLVSLDENRTAFLPTLMNKDDKVTEIWFSGAHADVGGGFWYDGLSDIALKFLINEFSRRNLGLEVMDVNRIDYRRLHSAAGDYRIELEDVFIKPNYRGKAHPKDRWLPVAKATLSIRDVRVSVDDRPSMKDKALIHHSAVKRIKKVMGYRPKSLKGIPHIVVYDKGGKDRRSFNGLRDHIVK